MVLREIITRFRIQYVEIVEMMAASVSELCACRMVDSL